jgi:hypothetical protein
MDLDEVERAVRALAAGNGLNVGPARALKTIPGSGHWHLSKGKGSGTLEVTFDPARSEMRVSVHENRRGRWAGDALQSFTATLEAELS